MSCPLPIVLPLDPVPFYSNGVVTFNPNSIGLIIAGIFTLMAITISSWIILQHLGNFRVKQEQRAIVRGIYIFPKAVKRLLTRASRSESYSWYPFIRSFPFYLSGSLKKRFILSFLEILMKVLSYFRSSTFSWHISALLIQRRNRPSWKEKIR